MKVTMNLERATHHVENTKALKLTEVDFKIKPNMKEHKRLFRPSLYELTIISEVNNQMYEFEGYQLDHKLISQLEKDPSNSRSEEHTSELQSRGHLVCRLLLEKKKKI